MIKKQKALILGIITVFFAALGYILLPDEVVMQVRIDGEPGNVATKFIAVLIPFVISGLGLYLYVSGDGKRDTKNFILVIAGFLVSIFEIVVNVIL